MAFHFYYDESEHSRKINLNTITADNYYDNFVTVIVGWNEKDEADIEKRYLSFEKKYEDRKSKGELKSTTIKQSQLKYGFASLKNDTEELISDFLGLFDNKIYVYFCAMSKVEYVIRQVLAGYHNSFLFDMDAMKYSITKAILTYQPRDVLECIYSDTEHLPEKLKEFLQHRIEINQSNPELKSSENQAFKEAIYILDEADNVKYEQWDYHAPFVGFKLFLTEQDISDYNLVIDREGEQHKTLNAARDCKISNVSEESSKEIIGIRMADMFAGLITKLMRSCSAALRGTAGTKVKKTLLSQEWFKIDDKKLTLYKKFNHVIMKLHASWAKAYGGGYSDDLISFTSLLEYMSQFKSADEIKANLKMQGEYFNTDVCNALQEHFKRMRNKLPIESLPRDTKDFFYNQKGAKVFVDAARQPLLPVKRSEIFEVLSVGIDRDWIPLVTVLEEKQPVCYRLPDDLQGWAINIVSMANTGMNLFPSKVKFSSLNEKWYADIL